MQQDKNSWLMQLMVFSLVPLSQMTLYFLVVNSSGIARELNNVQKTLNMGKAQLLTFQIIAILLFSIVSFLFMYLIDWLLLRLFSDKRDNSALFISLVLSLGLGNIVEIIIVSILNTQYPQAAAITQLLVLTGFYYSVSIAKDKTGSIILGIVTLLLNVIPSFLGTQISF